VPVRIVLYALGLTLLGAGCDDLREFKTAPGQVFRGEVIGSDSDPNASSFIRKGFASHTQLELHFDPSASEVVEPGDGGSSQRRRGPGRIDTFVCPDGRGDCDASDRTPGPFSNTPLLAIDSLAHDPLSQYTFPGGGRLRNDIAGARFVSSTDQGDLGRDALVFISLMESGNIELRAVAPAVLADDGESERVPALFGVFVLKRMRE
jgi:hypothetical protein